MAYGGEASANSANVVYPMADALPAARAVRGLADDMRTWRSSAYTDVSNAVGEWRGPQKTVLIQKRTSLNSTISSVAIALDHLAGQIARSWAAARGQQDRINHARWVQSEIDNDAWYENAWQFFAGEREYPPPPDDPPIPRPDGYYATRAPIKPEFE